jgi:F-type H+-transporting ATPase subunit delta
VSSRPVARRYAAAAFALAQERQQIDLWRAEMQKLDALFQDEVLRAACRNPAVSVARRVEVARRLAPDLTPPAQNLARLLIERQRTSEMGAIRQEFERLADERAGVVHAILTTATPLAGEEAARYQQALARKLDRQVRLRTEVDRDLVGGARIQIGDHLVDGTVRTKLEHLRQTLRS